MSDYLLQLKIKNAPFFNIMMESGYKTTSALSRACGISQAQLGDIMNLKISLFDKNGHIRSHIKKLADFLMYHPEELIPESHWFDALEKNTFEAEVSRDRMLEITRFDDPAKMIEFEETSFDGMISCLSEREKKVIKLRFEEGMTLEETSKELGGEKVSGQRIRQIEQKALRKMRHPVRLKSIIDHAGIYADVVDHDSVEA